MIRQRRAKTAVYVRSDVAGMELIVEEVGCDPRSYQLGWDRVTRVFAYKRDCFAIDQICLAIGSDDLEQWIEIAEDDGGFEEILEQLPIRLAGFPVRDEWWQRVALPPFRTQRTELYRRKRFESF